jgi:hypothetical protein
VEAQQLLAGAEAGLQMDSGKASKRRIVETDGLGELFGLDMAPLPPTDVKARAKKPRTRR